MLQLADILDDPTDHITARDVSAFLSSNDIKVMCFPKGNLVKMADGSEKDISEVKEGDVVKSFNNKSQKVLRTFKRNVDEDGVKINTEDKSIVCTSNHPIYVVSNYNEYLNGAEPIIDCVPACELNDNMAVLELED